MVAAIAVALVLCILCGLQSYAEPQSSEDQTTNTISGTVINGVTDEPIARALVYAADERAATFSDDHGNFELTVSAVTQPPGGGVPVKTSARLLLLVWLLQLVLADRKLLNLAFNVTQYMVVC